MHRVSDKLKPTVDGYYNQVGVTLWRQQIVRTVELVINNLSEEFYAVQIVCLPTTENRTYAGFSVDESLSPTPL